MMERTDIGDRISRLPPAKRRLFEKQLGIGFAPGSTSHRIPRRNRAGLLPQSFAQQRLWVLDQLEPGSSAYNTSVAFRLTGPLDIEGLKQSLNEIIRRHEALRTTFSVVDDQPVQVVAPSLTLKLEVLNLRELPEGEREGEVERLTGEEAHRPFDLARGPLFRAGLLKLDEAEHVLLMSMHHIVSDGWSRGVLYGELSHLYEAFHEGKVSSLADLPIQYGDFAIWQRQWLQGEVLDKQLGYWRERLEGAPAMLELPCDRPRPPVQTYQGERQSFVLSKSVSEGLKALSREEGVSLFMVLLAAFQVLLYRYAGQEDIVVGSPIANRTREEIEGLIGFFVNTLVLRSDLSGNPSFRELVNRVREVALGAYDHQDIPFERLVEELQPERDPSRTPLFQVMFGLQNALSEPLELKDLTVSPLELNIETAKFDLTLYIYDETQGLKGDFTFSTDRFNATTIARMAGHFERLLEGIVAEPGASISEFRLLTDAERYQLLEGWNDTASEYPGDRCIHELFEAQVERTPDNVAVEFEGQQLSYRELNVRANQLAHYLRKQGVGPEVLVGLCVERSVEMVVGVLGILKSGGAYLPLDPSHPRERLAHILDESKVPLLLTQKGFLQNLSGYEGNQFSIDGDANFLEKEDETDLARLGEPEHLSYVVYTSGSTGKPKGISSVQKGVINYLDFVTRKYSIESSDIVLQIPSLSFDASVRDLIGPLIKGARVILVNHDEAIDPLVLLSRIQSHNITCLLSVVPTLLKELVELANQNRLTFDSVRLILVSGEPFPLPTWRNALDVFGQRVQVVNQYGPTECTMTSTYYPLRFPRLKRDIALLGRPISNSQVYILDKLLNPAPIGVSGEVHIGGVGLSRGYQNQPALTAENFIPNPFSEQPGERLYKTGDLGRYLPDGNIEFLGRMDSQVKVRGVRIELGEIEAVLTRHSTLKDAVVLAREDGSGDRQLVAYVVGSREKSPKIKELRSFLKQKLPDCMVPSAFVTLERFPRTPSGKVDRQTLPAPERTRADLEAVFVAPRTSIEKKLAEVWAQLLGISEVGIHDSFFELGGYSLLATRVMSRLRDTYQTDIPLRTIFERPTVAGLAEIVETVLWTAEKENKVEHLKTQDERALIGMSALEFLSDLRRKKVKIWVEDNKLRYRAPKSALSPDLRDELARLKPEILAFLGIGRMEATPIRPLSKTGNSPLSFAQQRLWFLDQLEPGSSVYNIPAALRVTGQLDIEALERSLNEIIRRHEGLRTTFSVVDDEPVLVVAPSLALKLAVLDLRDLPERERAGEVERLAVEEAHGPFDLVRGPLFRAGLLKLDEAEHVLFLTMHHIVSDGWSMGVLFGELSHLYEAYHEGKAHSLPELPIQYRDFAVWQRQWLQGAVLEKQLGYWKDRLEGAPAMLELPCDCPRPPVQTYRGVRHSLMLSEFLTKSIEVFCKQEGVSLFMVLLAAFKVLLYRYAGQEDIVVGSPIANRTREEVEGLIGFFVNTLVLRTDLSGDPSFKELVKRVREVALGAYDHQDLPFEKLVEELQPQRTLNHTPLFQVFFNMLNLENREFELPGLIARRLRPVERNSKFDLTLYVRKQNAQIQLELVYNADLFRQDRMIEMLNQLKHLLSQSMENPEHTIASYSLVTTESARFLPNPSVALAEPPQELVTCMFATWAKRSPEQPAIRQGEKTWSYVDLAECANLLARTLVAKGVVKGDVVAIHAPQSFGSIVSMLGVFMSGGVLLTIDPNLPNQRKQVMLTEANARSLVYAGVGRPKDAWLKSNATLSSICVDPNTGRVTDAEIEVTPESIFLPDITLDDPAYVFFTSGTTGVPQGILGCHKGLSHFLSWQGETFAIEPKDRLAQLTGLSFDVVLRDILLPLTRGATLYLPENMDNSGPQEVLNWLEREQISLLHTVPTLAQSWLADVPQDISLHNLRWVFFAGEPLTDSLVRKWQDAFSGVGEVVNLYGPTETTLAKCFYHVPREPVPGTQPVGWPLPHAQALVFTDQRQLCGIGEAGEIVIRTPFRSLGYINAPKESRKRFVKNPFRDDDRDLLYYTGDRGRFRPDGSLEILGRLDDQVKIRGVRVEPDEVTATLGRHPAVKACVVLSGKDEQLQTYLVAYVVTADQDRGIIRELRSYLSQHLPTAMLPSAFMLMDTLPLTPNGKVDRKALPAPDLKKQSKVEYVEPGTPVEETVASIWSELLSIDRIGIHDNFFDLGGHSLLATRIVSRLRDTFQAEIPLGRFFEDPTVHDLAKTVAEVCGGNDIANEIAQTLRDIEFLSEEEIKTKIHGKKSE